MLHPLIPLGLVRKGLSHRGVAGGFFIGNINLGNSIFMAYGAEDVKEQQARTEYLERLYHADLRYMKEHPFHGLFTGLYQLYKNHGTYGRKQST